MKILLVTGGSGFIGSNFIKYFLSRNKNFIVVNIDKLSHPGSFSNLRELEDSPRYHFIKGDICNYELINYVLKKYKPDYVINFASELPKKNPSETDRFIERPTLFAETNIMGTLTLLEGLRYIWNGRSSKGNRFLQISTDEVYGNEEITSRTSSEYKLEEAKILPETSYSASKAAADLMVGAFSKSYHIPAIIARCCTNYGPNQDPDKFVPMCIKCATEEKTIRISEDDYMIKEWINVQDNTIALIRALFYGRPGEIYNIGSGDEASNFDIAKHIFKILNKPDELLETKDSPYRSNKHISLNSYKARTHLNWTRKINIEEGLKSTAQWYIKSIN